MERTQYAARHKIDNYKNLQHTRTQANFTARIEKNGSWVDLSGLRWSWVDLGGLGWGWVDLGGLGWSWVELGGVRWT